MHPDVDSDRIVRRHIDMVASHVDVALAKSLAYVSPIINDNSVGKLMAHEGVKEPSSSVDDDDCLCVGPRVGLAEHPVSDGSGVVVGGDAGCFTLGKTWISSDALGKLQVSLLAVCPMEAVSQEPEAELLVVGEPACSLAEAVCMPEVVVAASCKAPSPDNGHLLAAVAKGWACSVCGWRRSVRADFKRRACPGKHAVLAAADGLHRLWALGDAGFFCSLCGAWACSSRVVGL
ncbi:MAG: hypothetical protein ACKPKO_57200, partial [Candidatus Fonsibacter sp.]